MAELTLRDVRKTYGKVDVLHGIDLDLRSGEFVVFVGPSGCGKSTLLRCIAGLEDISTGEFLIDGERMNEVEPSRRGIAMVFQSYALYPHMTVAENMAFGLRIAGLPKAEIAARIARTAEILQLTPYLGRLPRALSGGQRQRVAIGRAIVRDPRVFLFDEPLSNLDAALRVAMRLELAKLKQSMPQVTMIYVTHDQVEAMTLADRIVVLNGGRIEQVGTPLELYRHPANLFVAQFIGSPAMNIIPATIRGTGGETVVQLASGGAITVPVTTGPEQRGRPARVGIRPEDLRPATGEATFVEGTIVQIEQLGEVQHVYLETPGLENLLIAKLPGTLPLASGQRLRLEAKVDALSMFSDEGAALSKQPAPESRGY